MSYPVAVIMILQAYATSAGSLSKQLRGAKLLGASCRLRWEGLGRGIKSPTLSATARRWADLPAVACSHCGTLHDVIF
jgi:hypothetical protein